VTLGGRAPAIRACITNPETTDADVEALVGALGKARAATS
jgi:hypothetical protein